MADRAARNRIAEWMAIPATLWITTIFSISVIFIVAYGSSFIYLIGYTNQLLPLFEGIIAGVIVFTFTGMFIAGRKLKYFYGSIAVTVILLAVFMEILKITQMVVPNSLLTLLAFMITSPYMPVSAFAMSFFRFSGARRIVDSALSVVIGIVSIAYIAIIYEASGQDNLASITGTLSYLSVISLAVLLLAVFLYHGKTIANPSS
jgi:hypothetical protein